MIKLKRSKNLEEKIELRSRGQAIYECIGLGFCKGSEKTHKSRENKRKLIRFEFSSPKAKQSQFFYLGPLTPRLYCKWPPRPTLHNLGRTLFLNPKIAM